MSTYRKRFQEFADVEIDGEKYLTLDRFKEALILPHPSAKPSAASTVTSSDDENEYLLFELADADNNGLVSFSEYCFLMLLLNMNPQHSNIAFKMFDRNGDGNIGISKPNLRMQMLPPFPHLTQAPPPPAF